MTSVNEKSFHDARAVLEDGMSVPTETKCPTAVSPKAAEPTAARSEVDTFETRAELADVKRQRAALKPALQEKETEAMRQLPKALPLVGTLSQVGFALWDLAQGDGKKQAVEAGKSMAETKAFNEVGRALVDKTGDPSLGEAVEAVAVFKDAHDIYSALREYGKLVEEDEALRYRAEDLMMKLDPTRKFELVELNGKTFFRQDGKLIHPQEKATGSDHDYVARIRCRNNERR